MDFDPITFKEIKLNQLSSKPDKAARGVLSLLYPFHVGKWKGRDVSEQSHTTKYNLVQVSLTIVVRTELLFMSSSNRANDSYGHMTIVLRQI